MHYFADPGLLYLLLTVPFLIIFYVVIFDRKKKAGDLFARSSLFQRLAPLVSLRNQKIKGVLILLGLTFLIISIAGPRWGEQEQEVTSEGVDIFIAIDCSQSMMAEDYKPNRLDFAKSVLKKIVDDLQGNRIGVIAFAGEAYVVCPLTVDVSAVKMYIDILDYTTIPVQGTSLGRAIDEALKNFPGKDKENMESCVLILLTDGEDLEKQAAKYAEEAKKKRVSIYTLGIGTSEGSEIPMKDQDDRRIAPKMDNQGKIVKSRLDETTLKNIAERTGGEYLRCTYDEKALHAIANNILGIRKKEYQQKLQKQYINRYQYPLVLALLLLTIEFFIPEVRRRNGEKS